MRTISYVALVELIFNVSICKVESLNSAVAPKFCNNFINVFRLIINSEIYDIADTLNVNIPREVKGLKITHQGVNTFDTEFIETEDGFLATGKSLYGVLENKPSCDLDAYHAGFVSITPITVDRTDYNVYNIYEKNMFK